MTFFRLQKLLNIAETKIAEKEAKLVDKDQIISDLESRIRTDMDIQPNNSAPDQCVDGGSGDTSLSSPSLLANTDPLSSKTTPSRNRSETVNHKWTKRKKKRKRLKQTTLTQHQNADHKRQKLDHSVKVIPQSPFIDLSTVQSDSSCEDKQPNLDLVSDDGSDEYGSSNENASSQNCDSTNQGCRTFSHNNSRLSCPDHTFVPDTSQHHSAGDQDLSTINHRDDTFVHDAANQVCNLTSQNCDHDHTFAPNDTTCIHSHDMVNQCLGSNGQTLSNSSTKQNHNIANQHMKDKR